MLYRQKGICSSSCKARLQSDSDCSNCCNLIFHLCTQALSAGEGAAILPHQWPVPKRSASTARLSERVLTLARVCFSIAGVSLPCQPTPLQELPPAQTHQCTKGPEDVQIFPVPCFHPIFREHIKTRSENISFSPKLKNRLQTKPSVTRSVLHLNSRGHVYSKTTSWEFCKHFMAPLGHWIKIKYWYVCSCW